MAAGVPRQNCRLECLLNKSREIEGNSMQLGKVGQDAWNQRLGHRRKRAELDRESSLRVGRPSGQPVWRPGLRISGDVAAAADLVLAAGDPGDGLSVGDVLLGEDAT